MCPGRSGWPRAPPARSSVTSPAATIRLAVIVALSACASGRPWGAAELAAPSSSARSVDVVVGRHGFAPHRIDVRQGEAVTFTFLRTVERTCVTRVIIRLDAEHRLERDLPMDQPTSITLRFTRAGEIGFTCPMDMYGATVTIR